MTGSLSGGHFIGFYVAILGLIALAVWASRPKTRKKLGERRLSQATALAAVLFVALGTFGNGRRTISFSTAIGPSAGVPAGVTQADVDAALGVVKEKSFVEYATKLVDVPPIERVDRLGRALAVRAGTTVDLKEAGIEVTPPPKIGESWLLVSYEDDENALFAAFDGGDGVRRMQLAKRLVTEVLPEVALISRVRAAKTDAEKAALLESATWSVPRAAAWVLGELDELAKGASPALADVIARKRAYVEKYVEEPAGR